MKKIFNKTLSFILVLTLVLGLFSGLTFTSSAANVLPSSGSCGTNVTYTFNSSSGLLTISGSGVMTNYSSSNSPFYNQTSIKTVVIENGVTSIGSSAFYYCRNLTSINITNSVTSIGGYAFCDCSSLTSVIIPNSVTSIGGYAFYSCDGLTSVTIGNSVTSIGNYAFSDCSRLTSVNISSIEAWCRISFFTTTENPLSYAHDLYLNGKLVTNLVIPNAVTSIGVCAFQGCRSLTSVTIPNSVTKIGSYAFYGCSGITSITIPNSVTRIGDSTFQGCSSLSSVTIPNSVTSIGDSAFKDCNSLTTATIGNSVTSIGNNAFDGCNKLNNIIIPDSVTSIGECAFYRCYGLTSVTIGNSVTSIGVCAFYYCRNLTSITIPNSVTSIGSEAFSYCSGLTSLTLGNSVTSIGGYAFYDCSKLTSVTIPDSVTSIGGYAFYNCNKLYYNGNASGSPWGAKIHFYYDDNFVYGDINKTSIIKYIGQNNTVAIPNSVTSIGDDAFYGCSGLTSITIPDSVTNIGSEAFRNCSGLTSVTIGNSVTSIGNSAFRGCRGLTSVTIPNSVTSIGGSAFEYCTGLTSITIPDSVTSIGYSAFSGCSKLTSVTIPDSVTSIGECAFAYCTGLTSITVASGNTKYDSRNHCNAIIEYATNNLIAGCKNTVIPTSVTSIDSCAFSDCSGLTSITIPDSVTSIGYSAFSGCTGLTSITIPNSVTSIGSKAFRNCSGLTSVTIPNSVTSIGSEAFSYCSGLTSIDIKGNNCSIYDSAVTLPKNATIIINGSKSVYNYAVKYNRNFICNHVEVIDEAKNPTCLEAGLTQGKHCDICNEVFIKQETVPAPGHTLSDESVRRNEVAPTCTKAGSYDEVFYCTVCKQEASRQTKPIEKLGHDMKLIERVAPTYTSQGYDYSECQRAGCDHFEYTNYVPATLASINISLKTPIKLLEKADASCHLRYNEEEIAQFGDYYYHYNYTLQKVGNAITLTSRDGVKDTYTFNEDTGEFTNSKGETIIPEITDTQSSSSPWQVGTNYFTVSYGDKSVQVPVTIEENRVVQVVLIPAKPYVYTQNSEGHWETYGTAPNQHSFFQYDIPEFRNGDLLSVCYKDGNDFYNIDFYYNESESAFISSAGERINKAEITCGFEDGDSRNWTIGEQNYFYFDYLGVRGYCSVKIRENFVQSISFTPVKPYEYVENCNNKEFSIWDDKTESYIEGYLYDDCDIYIAGNKLTVTYKNGSSDDFICKQTDDGLVFANENDEVIYPKSESNQISKPWTLGSNNFFTVKWSGATASVPVTIVETPVADIEYTPAKPIKLVENFGGHFEGDAFIYEYSPFNVGDEFVVYYKTGASKKYIAKVDENSDKVVFTDAKGNVLDGTIWVEDDQDIAPWEVSNYHACTLVYLGVSTLVPVSVVKNHDFVKEVTQPTCTEKGYTTYTCTYCNYSYVGDYVNPLGHDMLFHAGKEETCTQQGNNPYNECTRCHNYYSDNSGENIIEDKTSVIIPARNHNFEAVVIAPKAAAIGYTQYKCFCGEYEKDEAGKVIKDNFTAPTGKVSGFKCASRTATAEKFTWTKTSGVSGYQIQLLNSAGKSAGTATTTGNAYTFSKLTAGHAYKARVRFYIKAADGKNYYGAWATITSPTLPAGSAITKLTPAKKAFTAQWKKAAVTGYQLQYGTNAKFTKATTKTIKGAAKYSLKVANLKGGTKYFVRVRTYKTIGGKNYYSTWSSAKSVKTK